MQPENVNSPATVERIDLARPEAVVAVAYGRILGAKLLRLAKHGVLNLHPSLLPRHRGASPVQFAILSGDLETGVSIVRMDEGLDTGPVMAQESVPILAEETASELEARLAKLGASLLSATLTALAAGGITPVDQDESRATLTRRLTREDGLVRWADPAEKVARLWRAMHPWPGAHTLAAGRPVKIIGCRAAQDAPLESARPGTAAVVGDRLFIRTGDAWLEITALQPAGGRTMSPREFASGHSLLVSARWGA